MTKTFKGKPLFRFLNFGHWDLYLEFQSVKELSTKQIISGDNRGPLL